MRQGYKLLPQGHYKVLLEVGADRWQFPLPIVMTTANDWAFHVETGKQKLLQRRIENNEERVIKIAEFYAAAQQKYRAMTGTYADKFLGSSESKDGLYWEPGYDGIVSPLEPLMQRAENLGYRQRGKELPILSGYNFRILTAQGEYASGKTQSYFDASGRMTKGFGLIAYPTRYGVSGKRTFIVGTDGVVYARDLGENTDAKANKIVEFDPDPSWREGGNNIPVAPKKARVMTTSYETYPFVY